MAAFLMSLTLLMALLSFGRKTPKHKAKQAQNAHAKGGKRVKTALAKIAAFDVRFRRSIIAVFALITVFSMIGITRLIVDSNWLEDFSDDMPIKGITERIDTVMGGTTNIIYLFDSGEADGIKDPDFLREIERVQALADEHGWLVRKTYSIVDILKDLNQAFHGGDPDWYKLPETRELVAQYLLLYEMSGGEETEEYVSSDYRRANLELRLKLAMTSETAKVTKIIEDELAVTPLRTSTMTMTGIGALWLKLLDYIVDSQIQGFMLAFCVIAVVMISIFRSFSTGLISMVPNLAPVIFTLGVMGWLGVPLDYAKISIAAVAIGIAVDDTIHLLSRYWHEFKVHGDYAEALKASMQDVGRALLITSVALVSGFLVFTLSVMDSQAIYGILLATTIVTALVADFLLMPALILTFKSFGRERAKESPVDLREVA
jgi:predicted RND superfamily exporter protein